MTPVTSRILAIDDDKVHLTGLANGLERHGMPCLPIHFAGEATPIHACPDVRIIFADLHLGPGGLSTDHTTDFSTVGHLLEDAIKPAGPYCILLWTRYPDQAEALQKFLQRLRNVTKPVAVRALDKADHLDADGAVRDEGALMAEVDRLAKGWARPRGALALAGAWRGIDDRDVDAMIEDIYAARRRDTGRRPEN